MRMLLLGPVERPTELLLWLGEPNDLGLERTDIQVELTDAQVEKNPQVD